MARRLWVAAARAWTEYRATLAQTAIARTRTDYCSAAPKKKMEKMALGDFLADQCTHTPPTPKPNCNWTETYKKRSARIMGRRDGRAAAAFGRLWIQR
jgi:hypothetical protein